MRVNVKPGRTTASKIQEEPETATSVRATISFPFEQYAALGEIAKQKKVSLAWVVREAVDSYVEAKWPLFRLRG